MNTDYIIAGTDTDIGKTVFAAGLTQFLNAAYWKPVQSGLDNVDTKTVQNLTALPDEHFLPERYIFSDPLSPHLASEKDDVSLDISALNKPATDKRIIIELAGGLMVPYTRKNLQINHLKQWNAPVIVCARTGLGTLNHTLLSLEALWARKIPVHGIAFIGENNADNIRTISQFSGEKILGRLPHLNPLNAKTLKKAFAENFNSDDF